MPDLLFQLVQPPFPLTWEVMGLEQPACIQPSGD
jgi:hypothetical protein